MQDDTTETGLTLAQQRKLEMRALREGWPIPIDRKQEIIEHMCNIAAGKTVNGEVVTAGTAVKAFNSLVVAQKPIVGQNHLHLNFGDQIDDTDPTEVISRLLVGDKQ